jgi:hypothetical protein
MTEKIGRGNYWEIQKATHDMNPLQCAALSGEYRFCTGIFSLFKASALCLKYLLLEECWTPESLHDT